MKFTSVEWNFWKYKNLQTHPTHFIAPNNTNAPIPYYCIVFPIFRASCVLQKYVHTTYSTLNLGKNVTIKERSSLLKNNVNCTQFCSALIYCALVQNALHWIFLSLKASIQFMVQVDFLPEIKSCWKKKLQVPKKLGTQMNSKRNCNVLI